MNNKIKIGIVMLLFAISIIGVLDIMAALVLIIISLVLGGLTYIMVGAME